MAALLLVGVFLQYERFFITSRVLAFSLGLSAVYYWIFNGAVVHYGVMFFSVILIFNIIILVILNVVYMLDDYFKWRKISIICILVVCFLITSFMLVSADSHLGIDNHWMACSSKQKNIGEALKAYKEVNKVYPDSLQALNSGYLRRVPTCFTRSDETPVSAKAAGHYNYYYNVNVSDYFYEVTSDRQAYTISCQGKNHRVLNIEEGYPQYGSAEGLVPR